MDIKEIPYPIVLSSNREKLPSRKRPEESPPIGILIHGMAQYLMHEGKKLFAPDFLTALGLSAHGYIDVDGTQIHSVPVDRVAYHAGKSRFGEHTGLNTQWLGTEVLVEGLHDWASFKQAIMQGDPYKDAQYRSAAIQCRYWMSVYPSIRKEHILGHSQVSGPDVRPDPKIDPGQAWKWDTFWRWFELTGETIEAGQIDIAEQTN